LLVQVSYAMAARAAAEVLSSMRSGRPIRPIHMVSPLRRRSGSWGLDLLATRPETPSGVCPGVARILTTASPTSMAEPSFKGWKRNVSPLDAPAYTGQLARLASSRCPATKSAWLWVRNTPTIRAPSFLAWSR
jgi:hypothetical protein